jgi:predicted nicotinamide N-methyase
METDMTVANSLSLRALLRLDSALCAGMALVLVAAARPVAAMTDLPAGLLRGAGLSLAAVAVFIAIVASRPRTTPAAVRVVVAGNLAWSAASLALIAGSWLEPNGLGLALVTGQAVAVAALAGLEGAAYRRTSLA